MTTLEDINYQPTVWIGIYITIASFLCDLAMVADLLHSFRNKIFWFPCKYFSLNAAYIAVITVAMKLPMEIYATPPITDKATKPLSLAFMCIMMANFMPSLAVMDNRTLVANVIGLSILVVTMIVDIFIYIYNGVIHSTVSSVSMAGNSLLNFFTLAYIYIPMMLLLLVIMIESSLTIPLSKESLEVKYQTTNKTLLIDQHLQHTQTPKTEKLQQYVKRYWIMAEIGSPQFVMASNTLSIASGVICVIILVLNLLVVFTSQIILHRQKQYYYESDYRWSIYLIFIAQFIGVLVGAIAPIFRCFSVLSIKLVSNRSHFTVLKVENYWTQKLHEWKQSPIKFLSSSRSRTLIYNTKGIIISIFIILQKGIVILCKMISLIPTAIPIFVVYCWKSRKARLVTPPVVSKTDNTGINLSNYVLHIHDDVELGQKTLT
ncbi:uncharacterized protein LOC143591936 [Bidens hawaiensis]|uniref:uncharacterized protein LOC143591936 n=1 Tax=Bidens hawaiensis TaxID=980011 RepID=UPI0040495D51